MFLTRKASNRDERVKEDLRQQIINAVLKGEGGGGKQLTNTHSSNKKFKKQIKKIT